MAKQEDRHYCQFEALNDIPKNYPNPGLWLIIKQLIRKVTTVSIHHPRTKDFFRSSNAVLTEKLRHTHSDLWLSIHPFSVFSYGWRVIMCIVYILNVAFDLGETTFLLQSENLLFYYMIVVQVFSGMDVCFYFLIGYIENVRKMDYSGSYGNYKVAEMKVILKQDKIARHYLRTYFIFDSITFLNTGLMFLPQRWERRGIAYYLLPVRMLRHVRFRTMFKTVKLSLTIFFSDTQNVYRLFCLVFLFFYVKFCLTCMHILIPDVIMYFENKPRNCFASTLLQIYEQTGLNLTAGALYEHANYITGFTMVGTSFEFNWYFNTEGHIIHCLSLAFGFVFKACFFIIILKILNIKYKSQLKFLYFFKTAFHFGRMNDIEDNTSRHMYSYLKNTLKTEFFNEKEIMGTLQNNMRYEIFAQTSMDLVRTCHLFVNLPNLFISSLAQRLKLESYDAGIIIVALGDIANCMYFIRTGTVAVYGSEGREICHLCDGDYFGEIGLIHSITTRRVASVVSIEYSELYRLDMHDYQDVIKPKSEFYRRIEARSLKRLADRRKSSNLDDRAPFSLRDVAISKAYSMRNLSGSK